MSPIVSQRSLGLPTGTETLQLRRAQHVRRIGADLEHLFELWGYVPAETPLVDYAEAYRRLLSDRAARDTYRALDRQGETLLIRPDTTLFLAKQLGVHLHAEELPVRVYYNEQIVRVEDELDISRNEYQQAGVELVGVHGREGDSEVLLLLLEALVRVGMQHSVVHVGSHAVVEHLCAQLGVEVFDTEGNAELNHALRLRDRARFERLIREHAAVDDAVLGVTADLLFTIRPSDALTTIPPAALDAGGAPLAKLIDLITALVHGQRSGGPPGGAPAEPPNGTPGQAPVVRLDLSEMGGHDYYTGIAFAAYAPSAAGAIARGGRYDRLLASFGFDAPSVGFSIYPRKLPQAAEEALPVVARATGADWNARLSDARRRRAAGERVCL